MDLLRNGRARTEFERFAALHADALLRSAYLMAGDRGEAEDLVQECLLRLARKWPRVRSMEQTTAALEARVELVQALAVLPARQRAEGSQRFSLLVGRTGPGVTGVTLRRRNGTRVTASLANGWFLAWWPETQGGTATDVTTSTGTAVPVRVVG